MSAKKDSGHGECIDQAQDWVLYIHRHWGNCAVRYQGCQKDYRKASTGIWYPPEIFDLVTDSRQFSPIFLRHTIIVGSRNDVV